MQNCESMHETWKCFRYEFNHWRPKHSFHVSLQMETDSKGRAIHNANHTSHFVTPHTCSMRDYIVLFVFAINKHETNRDFNFTGRMKWFRV